MKFLDRFGEIYNASISFREVLKEKAKLYIENNELETAVYIIERIKNLDKQRGELFK